jgi:hypothetical protein
VLDARRAGGAISGCDPRAAFAAPRDFFFYAWRFS